MEETYVHTVSLKATEADDGDGPLKANLDIDIGSKFRRNFVPHIFMFDLNIGNNDTNRLPNYVKINVSFFVHYKLNNCLTVHNKLR